MFLAHCQKFPQIWSSCNLLIQNYKSWLIVLQCYFYNYSRAKSIDNSFCIYYIDINLKEQFQTGTDLQMTKKKQRFSKVAGFIVKLTEILKKKQNQDIVAYDLQQKSFTIRNVRKFTQQILPRYFKHRNYSSFIRQVNLYDFHKIRQQAKQQTYNHPSFELGNNKQLKKIKRKPMGFQKNRHNKKDINNSQSESQQQVQHQDVQEQYIEKQSQRLKSSQIKEQEIKESEIKESEIKENSKSVNDEIQQLQRKKLVLQGKIRMEQIANQKLQNENSNLKNSFMTENLGFYKEILKILQNIVISQYNQSQINREAYDKLVKYIYQEQYKLIKYQSEINCNKYKGKTQRKKEIYKQSSFLSLIKQFLSQKKSMGDVSFFIKMILQFTEKQKDREQLINNQYKGFPITRPKDLTPSNEKQSNIQPEAEHMSIQGFQPSKMHKTIPSKPNEKDFNQSQRRNNKKQSQGDDQYIPNHR